MTIPNIPTEPIAIYRISNGEIISTGGIQFIREFEEQQISAALLPWGDGEFALFRGHVSLETSYISFQNGEAIALDRPALRIFVSKSNLVADSVDSITLNGLPIPCEMIQDPGEPEEQRVTITGGGFVFTAENPGKYQFRIERFPFLPLNLEFTAT